MLMEIIYAEPPYGHLPRRVVRGRRASILPVLAESFVIRDPWVFSRRDN